MASAASLHEEPSCFKLPHQRPAIRQVCVPHDPVRWSRFSTPAQGLPHLADGWTVGHADGSLSAQVEAHDCGCYQ